MENKIKIDFWNKQYIERVNNSPLYELNLSNSQYLRIVNHQYDEIFNLLTLGKTITISNLDLMNKTLTQALTEAENNNSHQNKFSIFTSDDFNIQNKKLEELYNSNKSIFITYGLLDYFEDDSMKIKSAPLVLMPIIIEKITDKEAYQVKCIHHELRLNDALIKKLIDTRRIDISYPIDNEFSLIEYLTYVATKVRNNHFSVNNGCFILPIDLKALYYHFDFINHKNAISSLPLVKSISYLNSEFYNFNKPSSERLKNHYLSLLDLDNEEYKLLKRINLRENLVIKTNSKQNKEHLFTNIVNNFLLNDKKILITYNSNEDYLDIKNYLKNNHLDMFSMDLSKNSASKEEMLNRLTSFERLDFDIKLIDENKIDEVVDTYYLLKNNFKKMLNSLRKSNEPLKLSINRAIYEYYCLKDLPLISLDIPNANLIDDNKLNEYIDSIKTFVTSINNLNCHYKDHPFYGFNNLSLNQNDYINIKEQIINLSNEFEPTKRAYDLLTNKYKFPSPINLKEMKCLLNIISLLPECIKINQDYFEVENDDIVIEDLSLHNSLFNNLLSIKSSIISLYEGNVFLINHEELKEQLKTPLTKKIIKTYRPFFDKKVKIDNTILSRLSNELEEYYKIENQINKLLKKLSLYKPFYNEGVFNINAIKEKFALIKKFKEYCNYLNKNNSSFSYLDLLSFDDDMISSLMIDRKKAQISFNHLLNLINSLQEHFDINILDLSACPISSLNTKFTQASKNFSSINNYLDFYLTRKKLNKVLPSLDEALLEHNRTDEYVSIFIKRFYYDFIHSCLTSNDILKNNNKEMFIKNIENYNSFNTSRLETINAIIKSHIKNDIQKHSLSIKSLENAYLSTLSKQGIKTLPSFVILNKAKNTLKTLFPIFVMPIDEVPEIINQQDYNFDLNIVFADEKLQTSDSLPSIARSSQVITFDYQIFNTLSEDKIIPYNYESFIKSSSQCFNVVNCISSSYEYQILKTNSYNIPLKKYLSEKLSQEGFEVALDFNTSIGTIDILVKVPSSTRPIAIILDNLNYYSFESVINSINQTKENLEHLGFAHYHIITSMFFDNEDKNYEELIDFIITQSNQEKSKNKIVKLRPLVDVIFDEYVEPQEVYYKLPNKNEKSDSDLLLDFLVKTAPLKKETVIKVFGDKAISLLPTLQVSNIIKIANGFVFIEGGTINFRTVNREGDKIRDINDVSNEEISFGILKLLSQKSLQEDEVIKLILSSLGYKKMNHNQYFRIQNIINELKDDKKITEKENILYYE